MRFFGSLVKPGQITGWEEDSMPLCEYVAANFQVGKGNW